MVVIPTSGRLYGEYTDRGLESLNATLKDRLKGLKVDYRILVDRDGWVDIELEGTDTDVAARLVGNLLGVRPRNRGDLDRCTTWVGRVEAITGEGIVIDMKLIKVIVASRTVSLQLEDSYEEAVARYGLYPNVPVEVAIYKMNSGDRYTACFSDNFLAKLHGWGVTGLNRILTTGVTSSIVRRHLKRSYMEKYIAYYERLGILEHHIVCKIASNPYRIAQALRSVLKGVDIYVVRPKPIGYLSLLHT